LSKLTLIVCARCQRERPHHARGLCASCASALRRNPNAPRNVAHGMIVCPRCQRERPYHAKGLCASCAATLNRNPNASIGRRGRDHPGYRHGHLVGGARTPEYKAWLSARDRCSRPKNPNWPNYGGRGLEFSSVFKGKGGFERFLAEVGLRPGKGYSLDRIDNDLGYLEENLRWSLSIQQNNNRRPQKKPANALRLTHNGESLLVSEWAARLELTPTTIRERMNQDWPHERVLTSTDQRRTKRQVVAEVAA
jgi:hypothetical protein